MSNPYEKYDLNQLKQKRMLCIIILKNLTGAWSDDPRASEQVERYRGMRKNIDKAITAKKREAGINPEPITIGVRPVIMAGKAKGG